MQPVVALAAVTAGVLRPWYNPGVCVALSCHAEVKLKPQNAGEELDGIQLDPLVAPKKRK